MKFTRARPDKTPPPSGRVDILVNNAATVEPLGPTISGTAPVGA